MRELVTVADHDRNLAEPPAGLYPSTMPLPDNVWTMFDLLAQASERYRKATGWRVVIVGGAVLLTVSVALLLVTLPWELETTTLKSEPLSAAVVAGVV